MRVSVVLPLLVAAACTACTALDHDPEQYVEALKPDLYFVIPLPHQAIGGVIMFATTRPPRPPLPVNVRVITWANEGGNIYDDTLGDIMLDSPAEQGDFLSWSGPLVPPFRSSFDKVGLELRTFLPVVAYMPIPTTGAYAELDFMGAGIVGFGEWIDAILQMWVQCRGVVGQLIACHGLHYVVAPQVFISLVGASSRAQGADVAEQLFAYILTPELYMGETKDGWYYRAPAPGEYARWKLLNAYPTHGPFASAEEALRDAAVTLNVSFSAWQLENIMKVAAPDGEMRREILERYEATRAQRALPVSGEEG